MAPSNDLDARRGRSWRNSHYLGRSYGGFRTVGAGPSAGGPVANPGNRTGVVAASEGGNGTSSVRGRVGEPGSGKSTLAPALAGQLGLPLLAKDHIKDALVAVLDVCDVETSRRVGTAAVAAMLAIAHNCRAGAVLESNFYRSIAADQLGSLPGRVVEVFCSCHKSVPERRYQERRSTERAGYFDAERPADELWNDEIAQAVGGGWPVIEVDANVPVDVAGTTGQIQALAARYPTRSPQADS